MKASIILLGLGLALATHIAEPVAVAAGTSLAGLGTMELAWMVISGASLLTVANLVRRYVP